MYYTMVAGVRTLITQHFPQQVAPNAYLNAFINIARKRSPPEPTSIIEVKLHIVPY